MVPVSLKSKFLELLAQTNQSDFSEPFCKVTIIVTLFTSDFSDNSCHVFSTGNLPENTRPELAMTEAGISAIFYVIAIINGLARQQVTIFSNSDGPDRVNYCCLQNPDLAILRWPPLYQYGFILIFG